MILIFLHTMLLFCLNVIPCAHINIRLINFMGIYKGIQHILYFWGPNQLSRLKCNLNSANNLWLSMYYTLSQDIYAAFS